MTELLQDDARRLRVCYDLYLYLERPDALGKDQSGFIVLVGPREGFVAFCRDSARAIDGSPTKIEQDADGDLVLTRTDGSKQTWVHFERFERALAWAEGTLYDPLAGVYKVQPVKEPEPPQPETVTVKARWTFDECDGIDVVVPAGKEEDRDAIAEALVAAGRPVPGKWKYSSDGAVVLVRPNFSDKWLHYSMDELVAVNGHWYPKKYAPKGKTTWFNTNTGVKVELDSDLSDDDVMKAVIEAGLKRYPSWDIVRGGGQVIDTARGGRTLTFTTDFFQKVKGAFKS